MPSSGSVKVKVEDEDEDTSDPVKVKAKIKTDFNKVLSLSLRDKLTTFSGVGGWCGRMENKAISAFNYVEVEIEVQAELGNNLKCEDGLQMKTT